MPTSLAQQLSQNASLNSSLLVDRTKRKITQSYLFSGREADQHDLDSVYALAANGFLQLSALEPALRSYEAKLFSDTAKVTDRTLLPDISNKELDGAIEGFLPLLGPFLMETPTGKVLEWLVRRFRIHEFNIQAVVALFMPYHESPHFVKMLSILHISESSQFASLLPYKSTSTKLTRTALVGIMLSSTDADFARFVAMQLATVIQIDGMRAVHRALIAFYSGVLFEFVKRKQEGRMGKRMDEGTAVWYLSAVIQPMHTCSTARVEPSREGLMREIILSSFLLLSALSHTSALSSAALSGILRNITSCASRVSCKHIVTSLVAVCAGQKEVPPDAFPPTLVKDIAELSGLESELKEILSYAGSEQLILGLLATLTSQLHKEGFFNIILSLVPVSNVPQNIIAVMTTSLITNHSQENLSEEMQQVVDGRTRALLLQVQQRYPTILQACFDSAMAGEGADKDYLEQKLLSLSIDVPLIGDKSEQQDMVVASANIDGNIRAIAVRELYAKLSSSSLADFEVSSVRSALLARIQDTNINVLEALYAEPAMLLPILVENIGGYVTTLHQTLQSASKGVLKTHLQFVATYIYTAVSNRPHLHHSLFHELFFPFLLFSKPRQKAASVVWEIIEGTDVGNGGTASIGRYQLLGGCVDAVRWQEAAAGQADGRGFAKINLDVANKIAENMVVSDSVSEHLEAFLPKLNSENVYVRALGHLVLRAILGRLSDERRTSAGCQVIRAMGVENLTEIGELLAGVGNIPAFLADANLAHAVFSKPSSTNTLHRLQCAILIMPSMWSRPVDTALQWVDTPDEHDAPEYVQLMRTVYRLANSSANALVLSSYLLRSLFITLADETLSFLAGIWLHAASDPDGTVLTYVALYHAAAFLEAHHASQHALDFQTVLPAILVALQHSDRRVREAAAQCVAALERLSSAKKPTGVYAYDAIYGASSALLYLDWSDFNRYIQALNASADHIFSDSTYLQIFQRDVLMVTKTDSKKDAGFKQRVLSYVLSHVNACHLTVVKVSLLRSLVNVSSAIKMKMLLPAIEGLADRSHVAQSVSVNVVEELAALLVSSIDGSSVKDLNDVQGASWTTYKRIVHLYFQPGSYASPREAISIRLRASLFSGLTLERRIEVCQWFLHLGQQNSTIAKECRTILMDVISEATLIIQLLFNLQPASQPVHRASKRSKADITAEVSDNDTLSSLSLLAEIVASKKLHGSVELISSLLDVLTKVVHDASADAGDKVFAEQVVMSALENVALSMPEGSNMPSTVRLDILVELIRVSESPQTFNQALLLTATLSRLAPSAILHNIMPIFTFMGSNVFHRDDSYSFKVVQKTIDSIVPVMAASLQDEHPERLDMLIASRTFLRIFTDAANHIPRHRRTSFFAQLVDALGADDFLAPVCMLLVDKMSNRVARQTSSDAHNSLFLPLSVLERYPTELRLQTLLELLYEARRLVQADTDSSIPVRRFLELPLDEEASSSVSVIRRQALSILAYVGHALREMVISSVDSDVSGALLANIISLLLDLATLKDSKSPVDDIVKTARVATENALRVMSAKDFVQSVLIVLERGVSVQEGALDLLGDQLVNVAEETRSGLTKTVVKIVEHIRKLLKSKLDTTTIVACFHAVDAIATTMCAGEESVLTTVVPVSVTYVRDRKCTSQALITLHSLSLQLGPRVIPFFKDTVSACVGVLRDPINSDSSADEMSPAVTALNTLQVLLSKIPKFWSSAELAQVVNLYLDKPSAGLFTFMKAISKGAQPKVLLPLLSDVWLSLSSSRNENTHTRMTNYFTFLKRCIRNTPRDTIAANTRALFTSFLDAFQVCASVPALFHSIISNVVSAFLELVVKLNESTFRPLFRKLFDWAFASDVADEQRVLVFIHVYSALLEYLKGLMTPYMSLLLQPFLSILDSHVKEGAANEDLWVAVLSNLKATFLYDEGMFWREDRFKQISRSLVAQMAVAARLNSSHAKEAVTEGLLALLEVVHSDTTLKAINLDVLMHSRSEDAKLRALALSCSEALWRRHGGKLMGFVSETATFIAEAAEDANDNVVKEAHRLKNAVQALAGNIDV